MPDTKNETAPTPAKITTRIVSAHRAKQRMAMADLKQKILASYIRSCQLLKSLSLVGVDYARHYEWLTADLDYRAKIEQAKVAITKRLEDEAHRRAAVGVKKDVYYQGKVVGHEKYLSDLLLIFLLKAQKPEMYRDKYEFSGPNGGPIEIRDLTKLSTVELRKLEELVIKVALPLGSQG